MAMQKVSVWSTVLLVHTQIHETSASSISQEGIVKTFISDAKPTFDIDAFK